MRDWKEVLTPANATLRDAMVRIDVSALQMAIMVHHDGQLLGVISDGDIRRALLTGRTLDSPALDIANTNPITAPTSTSKQELLGLMRRKTVHQIPLIDEENRVAGLTTLDELTGIFERPNWVILMAGGEGSRLRPLTDACPKPLLRIGSKPILETIIENFAEQGFRQFYISVNYLADAIKAHFGNGQALGVNIEYLHEKNKLGTAGGLSILPGTPTEPLIVMNGDVLTNARFDNMLNYHIDQKAMATMAVREFEYQIPYGVVDIKDNRLMRVDEKPIKKHYVSAGIYVLSPEAISTIPKEEYFDMTTLFEDILSSTPKVSTYPLREYWLDIGRIEEFEKAQQDWTEGTYN
ncbi:MAG: nucleotidyltransferase family protein [Legionellales bacterium]